MIPCPELSCQTDLQRVTPHEADLVEFRGLSGGQLGVARHLVTVHRGHYAPADAAAVSRAWTE